MRRNDRRGRSAPAGRQETREPHRWTFTPRRSSSSTLAGRTTPASRPRGLALPGGPASVLAEGSPRADRAVYELGVPVLGICYGLQLFAHELGGRVAGAAHREF